MSNIADEQMSKMVEKAPKAAETTAKALAKTAKTALNVTQGTGKIAVKGICIILGKGIPFTTGNIMRGLNAVIYSKTGNIKFSNRNVNINELRQTKNVQMVNEDILSEQMKYFDKHCKEFGVKYSAIYDKSKDSYTIFYEGKNTAEILKVIEKSLGDYLNDERDQKQPESQQKKQDKKRNRSPKERSSVMAKLAFFRHRVADRDAQEREQGVEKNMQKTDIQR